MERKGVLRKEAHLCRKWPTKRSWLCFCDWQRTPARPSVLCVYSGSQYIECECIFHDKALGVRERKGRWMEDSLSSVSSNTQTETVTSKETFVLYLLACVILSICCRHSCKNTFLCSVRGCTAGCQMMCLQWLSLFSCPPQMQHIAGAAVANVCHSEVLCEMVLAILLAQPRSWGSTEIIGFTERCLWGLTGELRPVR